ncbi:hypothetical protein [Bradyrhizobium sp. Ce-3]|uniref:hypothetical protein n=1 Tax=Bradyrhizobium sp. Ce-3 TaxID=2913970 RepID=UPI001FBB2B88|nr:hypothetical protein [Bradyrhizobium sp. Ce-3]
MKIRLPGSRIFLCDIESTPHWKQPRALTNKGSLEIEEHFGGFNFGGGNGQLDLAGTEFDWASG